MRATVAASLLRGMKYFFDNLSIKLILQGMNWIWKKFDDLTLQELYDIMAARQEVFVVGQKCAYLDADGIDAGSWHLLGYRGKDLVAYLRVVAPGLKYPEMSLGRVLTVPKVRGEGVGRELTAESLKRIESTFGHKPLRISAQAYLEKFYSDFGFKTVSAPYQEDDIPHVEMFRN